MVNRWLFFTGAVVLAVGAFWFFAPSIFGVQSVVSFHLFSYPEPSVGPWTFYVVSHESRVVSGPYSEFFKANVQVDSDVWAIVAQITVTQTAYILHWGILRQPYWSEDENIDEIYSCSPSEMWVKVSGSGGSRSLVADGMRATLTIDSPDPSRQGLVTVTWGPDTGNGNGGGNEDSHRPTFIGGLLTMITGLGLMFGSWFT